MHGSLHLLAVLALVGSASANNYDCLGSVNLTCADLLVTSSGAPVSGTYCALAAGDLATKGATESLLLSKLDIVSVHRCAFAGFKNIQIIDLSFNKIESLPAKLFDGVGYGLPLLTNLYLENNLLTAMPAAALNAAPPRGFPDRSGLPSLIWLYLYKNKITEIGEGDLVNIPSLEILRIYDNSISKVHPSAFKGLTNMIELLAYGNQIGPALPTGLWMDTTAMENLNLMNNKITGGFIDFGGLASTAPCADGTGCSDGKGTECPCVYHLTTLKLAGNAGLTCISKEKDQITSLTKANYNGPTTDCSDSGGGTGDNGKGKHGGLGVAATVAISVVAVGAGVAGFLLFLRWRKNRDVSSQFSSLNNNA